MSRLTRILRFADIQAVADLITFKPPRLTQSNRGRRLADLISVLIGFQNMKGKVFHDYDVYDIAVSRWTYNRHLGILSICRGTGGKAIKTFRIGDFGLGKELADEDTVGVRIPPVGAGDGYGGWDQARSDPSYL